MESARFEANTSPKRALIQQNADLSPSKKLPETAFDDYVDTTMNYQKPKAQPYSKMVTP